MPVSLCRCVLSGTLLLLALLQGCSRPTTLEKIRQEGVIHVITRNGPITYFEGRDGPAGYEYELARMLAEHLGVELRVRVVADLEQIYAVTEQQFTHLAAVGVSRQAVQQRNPAFRLSAPFLEFRPLVVYRKGRTKPQGIEDLVGKHIVVPSQSAQSDYLSTLKAGAFPDLEWQSMEDAETAELMQLVEDQSVDVAIVNSIEYAVHSALYPQVLEAFDLMGTLSVSWILPPGDDDSLLKVVDSFLQETERQGKLIALQEHYYSHVDQLDYVGASTYMRHIRDRLPLFIEHFRKAGDQYGMDWRLLAAIGYQESHWNPYATSPTGVRGLMMLTQNTAREVGVANRLDPAQSIRGGAAYFSEVKKRLPERISEPHRTWFALAAYNVGLGHLEDARLITRQQGYDPDVWEHVKKHLPLLQQQAWYSKTRHGYARGWEPVHFVQNIRRYHEVLGWKMPDEQGLTDEDQTAYPPDFEDRMEDMETLPDPFLITPPTL